MKIAILDEKVIKDVVDILIDRPEVISVFVEGLNIDIESIDINSLVEYLEKEHGIHLIVNGNSYMVASQTNEGLAQDASEAGARAADAASSGLVSKTQEFMKKKRDEVRTDTDAELDEKAKEEVRDAEERGEIGDEVVDKFRGIKAASKETNPDVIEKTVQSREIKKMLDRDPQFVKLLKMMVAQADEDGNEEEFVRVPRSVLEKE